MRAEGKIFQIFEAEFFEYLERKLFVFCFQGKSEIQCSLIERLLVKLIFSETELLNFIENSRIYFVKVLALVPGQQLEGIQLNF